jgi:hypothetical protein
LCVVAVVVVVVVVMVVVVCVLDAHVMKLFFSFCRFNLVKKLLSVKIHIQTIYVIAMCYKALCYVYSLNKLKRM